MNTTQLLIPVCAVLGVLVWWDNSQRDPSSVGGGQVVGAVERDSRAPKLTPDQPQGGSPSSAPAGAAGNPLATVDKEALSATVDRPLFAPQRSRPPVVPEERAAAPPPPPPAPLPTYALLGVVTNDGRAIALLSRTEDGTSFRVEKGETIGGWQVGDVGSKSVSLVGQDGTTVTVPLSDNRSKSQPASDGSAAE